MDDYPKEQYAVTDFVNRYRYLGKIYNDRFEILESLANRPVQSVFREFIEFEDVGLPLAFLLAFGIVSRTPKAKEIVDATWSNLMSLTLDGDGAFDGDETEVVRLIIHGMEQNL